MHDVYSGENTDVVLLIDAVNSFNLINGKVLLHNMKFLCPLISTYICDYYATSSRLFISGTGETLSKKRTTQDDLASMGLYALGIFQCCRLCLILS